MTTPYTHIPILSEPPWTVYRLGSRVYVSHTSPDVCVTVDDAEVGVFGESGGSVCDRYAIRVSLPLTVLRAILEAVDAAKEQG